MASIKKHQNKSGETFYEIRCHIDRDRSILSKRWYPPDGWSQKAIDRELKKVAAEFERQCKAGEILSKSERAKRAAKEAEEAAKILSFRQYSEQVFLPAKAIHCSQNTLSSFQGNLNRYLYPALTCPGVSYGVSVCVISSQIFPFCWWSKIYHDFNLLKNPL